MRSFCVACTIGLMASLLPPVLMWKPIQLPSHKDVQRTPFHQIRKATTALNLLKGLQPTVDDEINEEMANARMGMFDLFQLRLEEGDNIFQAFAAVSQRRKDKAGDYENKFKILSDYRSYTNRELLDTDHVNQEPTLDDLNQNQPDKIKLLWATSLFRLSVFFAAFNAFPYLCNLLATVVEISGDEFDIINEQFTPGVGILYGTFVALTLDILYERQGKVQENASIEASLLSQVTQNILNLFREETDVAREATQIIADQVRIIAYRSRGSEMLNIMRSDPYARLLSIVDHYQRDKKRFTPQQEALIDNLRGDIPGLMEARAKRLSDEASSLPPTHFLVLILLTALSLIGFTAATLSITDTDGCPPLESKMVFAGLSAVYVLFFNFCSDMNDPFDGVYQIKRSSAASFLLQVKWLISQQSFGQDIRFDTRADFDPVYDGNDVLVIGTRSTKLYADEMKLTQQGEIELVAQQGEIELVAQQGEIELVAQQGEIELVASKAADTWIKSPLELSSFDTIELKPKVTSASAFLPERQMRSLVKHRKKTTVQKHAINVSSTISQLASDVGSATPKTMKVPPKTTQSKAPVDRTTISMNFRKSSGFSQ